MPKLIRITTVPVSLNILLRGQHAFMRQQGFEVIGVSSGGGELQEVAQREQISTRRIEMARTISPLKDLKSLWQLYKLFRKEKPDIVHSHTPKAGLLGMLAARLSGVPIRLHTVAGLPLTESRGAKRKLLEFTEKLTYRCAHRIYPNSQGLCDFILQKKFTDNKKLKIIGGGSSNGIDSAHFSPECLGEEQKKELKKQLGIHENDFVFVFVGRLVGDKGINELVNAFVGLQNENTSEKAFGTTKLLLVGDTEAELDALQTSTLKEISENDDIIATGFQTDVRPYFAISDCLVFPSYREGFPNVVMQAGAMALPSVVSDINGCNEIIHHQTNGLIVPKKDVDGLGRAMRRMMSDPSARKRMKAAAREMIVSRYEQKQLWEALLTEYKELLKSKS